MRGRKLMIEWHETAEELQARYLIEHNIHLARRLQALYLLRKGKTIRETASIIALSTRSVEKWLAWYRQGGLNEVLRRSRGGARERKPLLTHQQQAELMKQASQEGFRTVREAVGWVAQRFGVLLSESQMRRLFQKFGFRRKVPRALAERADVQRQWRWKKGGFARHWWEMG